MRDLLKIRDTFSFISDVSGCVFYDISNNRLPHKNGIFIGAHDCGIYSKEILGPVESFSVDDIFVVTEINKEHSCINVLYTVAERVSDKKRIYFHQIIDLNVISSFDRKCPTLYPKYKKIKE